MDFTYESIEKLYAKGLINAKERSTLKVKVLKEQNNFDGLHTKFVNNLVEDFTKGWADLVTSVKKVGQTGGGTSIGESIPSSPAALLVQAAKSAGEVALSPAATAAWHALALLTLTPVITAGGRAAGQQLQDVLASHGVPSEVGVYAAALLDASVQLRSGQAIARVSGALPKASDVFKWIESDSSVVKKFSAAISDQTLKKAQALVESNAKKAAKEAESFITEKGPRMTEDQITSLMARTGETEAQRVAAQQARATAAMEAAAAQAAMEAEQRAAEAMRSQEQTHDLLGKAMETLRPRELTPTEKTLEAAAATIRGGSTAEQVLNRAQVKQLETAGDALLERMKTSTAPRGGAPGYQEYLDAAKRSAAAYDENYALLKSGKINIEETINQAKMLGIVPDDIAKITPGQAVDPIQIAANALAMKDHQREIWQLAQTAEREWATGNKQPFFKLVAEFNRLREIDPNFRMPLQTSGQTLRIAGDPLVNVTRYQDRVVKTGSWLAGEQLNSLDEVEANAVNIMRRLKELGDPDTVGTFARSINTQGDEVLKEPTFRDYAGFLFKNSIMSSTDTLLGRNPSGNIIAAPWHYAEKMVGGAAAKVLNPFLSAKHHIETGYASEANDFITTWASSMWDATKYALTKRWDKLAEMVPEQARADLFAGRYDLAKYTTTGTTNPFGGRFGRIVGAPVSFSQAADEVARVAVYRAAVSERLKHDWLETGSNLSWQAFRERGFANVAPEMHSYGVRMAGLMTYSDDPSVFGRLISQGRQLVEGAEQVPSWARQSALLMSDWVLPFVRTTDRLMAYGYNRSPVLSAFSTKTLTEFNSGDPLARQEAIGRILFSSILGSGFFLASRAKAPDGETFITGGGPTNRALAKSLRDGGVIHPYTIWTPAGRLPYHFMQPIAAPMGLMADTAEIFDELKTTDAEGLLTGSLLAFSRNLVDTTFNQQIADVINVFDNPGNQSGMERILSRMGSNVIRGYVEPGILRQAFRNYDPTVKEAYTFWDELARDVPGWGGPPKINPRTGEPVLNPPRLLQGTPFGWFLPTAPIQSEDDAVRNKFLELKMPFPQFPKAYGGGNPSQSSFAYSGPLGASREAGAGIAYTPEQINKGQRYVHLPDESGTTPDQEVKELLADPEFHKLAPIVQAEQIQAVYNSRLNRAVGLLREEYPELDVQLEAKKQLRGELRTSPEDRIGIDAEENSSPEPPVEQEPFTSQLENPVMEQAAPAEQPVSP